MLLFFPFSLDSSSSEARRPWYLESDYESPLPDLGISKPRMLGKDKEPVVEEANSSHSIPTTFGVANFEDKWITRGVELLPPKKKAIFS